MILSTTKLSLSTLPNIKKKKKELVLNTIQKLPLLKRTLYHSFQSRNSLFGQTKTILQSQHPFLFQKSNKKVKITLRK
ncbi:hypothetical protein M33023_01120 [Candidatus Phytoplasma asteris]|uniref:Uncharacterized protein n=2 Tax=16SrI (Aster yellows group) TaxID=3042590 RepID=Q2NK24_AYWBP|nr:hypothetical protein [Aster yellows witches'-broom phytoplasma]ABC65219.1 conserved hypothetical protein [Aster yellows witches'-broom phytoplasma AYWB]